MARSKKTASKLQNWTFEAVDQDGKVTKGKVAAETHADAITAVEVNGLTPLTVAQKSSTEINTPFTDRPLKFKIGEKAVFARQLYMLVKSGLQLTKALSVLSEDNDDPKYVAVLKDLEDAVLSGVKFSVALSKHPRCFDKVFISYIIAGEETGDIQESLRMLSVQLDNQRNLQLKVKSVTAYPRMMGFMIGLITIGILWKLVPIFEGIYAKSGAPLPAPTRIVMTISRNMWIPLFLIAAAIAGFIFYLKKNADNLPLRSKVEQKKYKIPVLGQLARDVMMHRWATTLAGSLHAGMQTMPAMAIAAGASGSYWVRVISEEIVEGIRLGRPLSSEIRKHPELFDARTRAMASSGEEAGEVAEMFDALGNTIESEINAQVAVLGARLEVGLLVLMGAVVGVLLVALYMPIFGMVNTVQSGYSE